MNNVGLSSLNNTYCSNINQEQAVKFERQENTHTSQVKQGNKQIMLTLAGLSAIAIAGIAIFMNASNGKATKISLDGQMEKLGEQAKTVSDKVNTSLSSGEKIIPTAPTINNSVQKANNVGITEQTSVPAPIIEEKIKQQPSVQKSKSNSEGKIALQEKTNTAVSQPETEEVLISKKSDIVQKKAAPICSQPEKDFEKERYNNILQDMEKLKKVSLNVDELMKDEAKMQEFLHTKITIQKSKYDATMIETTVDEALSKTILGTYKEAPEILYHGTTKYSYDDIIKNGFSLDCCRINESGKGIYFGVDKAGAENYSNTGAIIKAKYTGEKIADVIPGVAGSIGEQYRIRSLAQDIFNLDFMDDNTPRELIAKCYTQKLKSLGYDAIHSASLGAKCEYIAVLDPSKIQIVK